jgi:hypothetical protein
MYTIYTRTLSVQAQYSKLCPVSSQPSNNVDCVVLTKFLYPCHRAHSREHFIDCKKKKRKKKKKKKKKNWTLVVALRVLHFGYAYLSHE